MRTPCWLVVLAGSLVCRRRAAGQPDPAPTDLRTVSTARRTRLTFRRLRPVGYVPRGYRTIYLAPLGYRSYYGSPFDPYFWPGYRPRLTIVTVPPPPPIIIVQQPPTVLFANPLPLPRLRPDGVRPLPPPPENDDLPPPRKAEKEKPKEPARPPARAAVEARVPRLPGPDADPRNEYRHLVHVGREAFAERQYGRAAQRFRQASRLVDTEPEAFFLLGQALLAQGNFRAAFDAIRDGMRRRPNWPEAPFRPVELYGRNVDEYTALLRSTEKALARHPLDPELLFLRGYVLWFDGRREEARPFFRKALPTARNRGDIDRFLRALPDDAPL